MFLEVKNISVYYGSVRALENISFNVSEKEIVAMIGPNGAGKSTALKAVSGLLQAVDGEIKSGDIVFNGKSILGLRTDELVKEGISLVPEGRRVFPTMTVYENLEMGGFNRNSKTGIKDDIEKIFDLFPHLKGRKKQKAGTLSSGEQQMLAIGRALMAKPRLLLADEPSLGLSPNYVDIIFDKLTEISNYGTSILLVEQNARMALEICHRGYVFEIGKIVLEDSSGNLLKSEVIKKAFLGG